VLPVHAHPEVHKLHIPNEVQGITSAANVRG